MAALAVAALVAGVAAALLFRSLEIAGRDADAFAAQRGASLSLEALASDLAAQPDLPSLPAPMGHFAIGKDAPRVSFFIAEADGPHAVAWFLKGGSPGELRRVEAPASATSAALPGNAADALAVAESSGASTGQSVLFCAGALSLELCTAEENAPAQLLMRHLSAEGVRRLASGQTTENLPERCRILSARPVPGK